MNAVFVESIGIGESMYYGPGAGQKPTATSVLADIIRIARRLSDGNVGKPFNEFHRDLPLANPADVKSNYYFALDTPDEKVKSFTCLKSSTQKIFRLNKSCNKSKWHNSSYRCDYTCYV